MLRLVNEQHRTSRHPRDRFITVFGRKPVLEALQTPGVEIDKLLMSRSARGNTVEAIERVAGERGVPIQRVEGREVTRLSRNRKQDQGVVADVIAPQMEALAEYLARPDRPHVEQLLLLDGLTTPANVGMVIRSAAAAGLQGIVIPRVGCPEVGPLVVKASAGVAFRARILRTPAVGEALPQLTQAGFELVALSANAAESLYCAEFGPKIAIVLGNESDGLSAGTQAAVTRDVSIPLAGQVESLNAAVAGSVVAFELARRRGTP